MTQADKEKNWKEPHEFVQAPPYRGFLQAGQCVCGCLRETPLHTDTYHVGGAVEVASGLTFEEEKQIEANFFEKQPKEPSLKFEEKQCACGGVMTHPKTVHTASGCVVEPTEVGESWARNFSKNANAYIAFFQGCREGKRVIYAMPEGEIYSPAKHAEIVAEARQRAYEEGMQNKWTAELDIVRKVAFEAGKQAMREELREAVNKLAVHLVEKPMRINATGIHRTREREHAVSVSDVLDALKDTGSSNK